ncbi:MAG TPA: ABC transporter permease [Candidatus Sulfotelmatobacter sp.]|nr:ABC transporter permease [Candidatus Sulfotelmatobacter sp.]
MHSLVQDLRYGLRLFLRMPGFTVVAVLTLAIGIGANTAIFSVVDAVLLRQLAMVKPQRVMLIQESWKGVGGGGLSAGNFSDLRASTRVLQNVSASHSASFNLATESAPERIEGELATSDYFAAFGVQPILGRVFRADEDQPGSAQVAILSERLWRTHFHSDPAVVGRTITINALPYVVLGIMPSSFDPLLSDTEIWVPQAFTEGQLADHDNHYLNTFGRLKPAVSPSAARAELNLFAGRQQRLFPIDDKDRGFTATPLPDALLGDQRLTLFTMLGAVGFVLLIACANIANLQLARARARTKEIAARVALGASPRRIVRQLLVENILLGAAGALGGVLLAYFGVGWLVANAPAGVPRIGQSRVDGMALLFACGAAVFSGLLFGLAPALRAASVRLNEAFNESSGRTSPARDRVRSLLVVAEVALALMLLVGAGLLIRSALRVAKLDPGFDTSNLVVGRIGLPDVGYRDPLVARQTFERIMQNMQALPGVQSAAIVSRAPMTFGNNSNGLLPEGMPFDPSNLVDAQLRAISPGYLSVTHVALTAGREFSAEDTRQTPLVALVNETLARTMWPGQNPIGKRFQCCEQGPKGRLDPVWHEVVGVVSDVRAWGLDQRILPEFYIPFAQMPSAAWDWIGRTMDLVVRTHGGPVPVRELQNSVATVAPGVPIYSVSMMQEKISSRLQESHFDTFLLALFATTALLLAAVGVYGVLSYVVAQRTRDIGIRLALGAPRNYVLRQVLLQGMRLVGVGLLIGILGALLGSRLLSTLLFQLPVTDTITYVVVSSLLVGVALLASYLPARHASRVDPVIALRFE